MRAEKKRMEIALVMWDDNFTVPLSSGMRAGCGC